MYQKKKTQSVCAYCGKIYELYSHHLKKGQKYCGYDCFGAQRTKDWRTPQERFFRNISTATHENNCWIYSRLNPVSGYGQLMVNNKSMSAHRYSWVLHFDKIPYGLFVLHKCDTPACVNPDHLFLGNQFDNMQDCEKKGRCKRPMGENHPSSKLTEEKVRQIRIRLIDCKITQKKLGEEFGVSERTISSIKLGRVWAHVK